MKRMKELILSPEEIYYIGKVSGGKYLDYDYIAAMQDIGKRGKIKAQEILDGLERKGYAEEDFLGNLEVEPACTEMLQPVYQGMYESELILREESGASVHYKFHHMAGERKREDLHSAVLRSWCFTSGDRFSRIRIFWTTAGTVTKQK